tara:strand:+ start:1197 stop:2417 length:1221 start_codon:yes stop_codon:yes gene_type:complete
MSIHESASSENELYQDINWSSIIDSLNNEYKDKNILMSKEVIDELSGGYFSKSPWKLFEPTRGEQTSVIILKSFCAIYSNKTTNQIKVVSFYSNLENDWVRFRMIELVERFKNQLIEFNWDSRVIILNDINRKRRWEFELSEIELFLLKDLFECVLDEWSNLIQAVTQREIEEKKAIEKALLKYSEKTGLDLASKSNNPDEFIHISDLLEHPKDIKKLIHKYENKIIIIFKSSFQNIERLVVNLELKKKIISDIFDIIIKHSKIVDFVTHLSILKNEIYIYQLIYLYSIVLILAINDNKEECYEDIYRIFDELNLFNLEITKQYTTPFTESSDISNSFMQIYQHSRHLYNDLVKLNYLIDEFEYDFTASLKSELDAIKSATNCINLLKGIQKYNFYEIHEDRVTQD